LKNKHIRTTVLDDARDSTSIRDETLPPHVNAAPAQTEETSAMLISQRRRNHSVMAIYRQ
jgi:hypothetical protein